MERHRTTSKGSIDTRNESSTTGLAVMRADTACDGNTVFDRNRWALPTRNQPHPLSESVSIWMHTLTLTGELTHRSAHTLEVEIERLFDEGVTSITLDLRQLTHIDPLGVAVIAFRCRLSKRQGHGLLLIAGSRCVQCAFEEAGVIDQLPFQEDVLAARRLRDAAPGRAARGSCEQCPR
jgi:anti-anti-sigma factor